MTRPGENKHTNAVGTVWADWDAAAKRLQEKKELLLLWRVDMREDRYTSLGLPLRGRGRVK